jgi:hypothetical protein
MLEFGSDLGQVAFDRLEVNADSEALRKQLGRRIGIEENQQLPRPPRCVSHSRHIWAMLLSCVCKLSPRLQIRYTYSIGKENVE